LTESTDIVPVNGTEKTARLTPFSLISLIVYIFICALLCTAIGFSIHRVASRELALMVCIDGRDAGFVDSLGTVGSARDYVESSFSRSTGRNYSLDCDITYHFKLVDGDISYIDYDTCRAMLFDSCDEVITDAYSLYIDGTYVASAVSEDVLSEAVELIHGYYTELEAALNPAVAEIRFTGTFDTVFEQRSSRSLMTSEEIAALFGRESSFESDGHDNTAHIPGSLSSGAVALNFSAAENPSIDFGIPRVADSSDSKALRNIIKYDRIVHEVHTEIVPYTVENVTSPYYYDGFTFKSSDGSDGIIENVYEVVLRGDEVISKEFKYSNVISEMLPETYTTGTKEPPPAEPTGEFIWPLTHDFMISSYYGIYRGKFDGDGFHYGLDLTGEVGDYIFAADGGEVIHSGKRSTYGICVIIQHDSHTKTYYAHMDEALVEVGDKVYPGQLIGTIGMTGLTTGPHLHFEIRKDNVMVDPMDYMPER